MILDEIVRAKRLDLASTKIRVSLDALRQRPVFSEPRRGFGRAVSTAVRAIVAEVKKASPSKGVIRRDFDPVAIASAYAAGGARAISVLTEERYFQGHLDYLERIRGAVDVPLLRKDFIVDAYQLYEARAYGADAALLIAAILSDEEMRALLFLAEELNLSALVEVHTEDELTRAVRAGAGIIGINNRDLRSFRTSLETTERLVPLVPPGIHVIAESGIEDIADIERLEKSGVHAFLIGETLMRAADPGAKLAELLRGPG
jgi:indole-3-glycerol phosphate synthase